MSKRKSFVSEELEDDSLESKLLRRSHGDDEAPSQMETQPRKKSNKKDRPIVMSSKHPVPRYKPAIETQKVFKPRDPRFDPLCGELNEKIFRKSFGFVTDLKKQELTELHKVAKKTKDTEKVEKLKSVISQYSQDIKNTEKKARLDEQLSEWKKAEREKVSQGKTPYFLKKSAVKELQLIDEYETLKKSGKLESFMTKRRKKNAAKDHRYVPYARPSE